MGLLRNKKSEALTIILVVIIVAVLIGWLVNFSSRECRSDNDCAEDHYCGSDFSCHEIPVIEKTLVKNNLIIPSVIIGAAIIIAAFIMKIRPRQKGEQNLDEAKRSPDLSDFQDARKK